jgi:hypothetical protein
MAITFREIENPRKDMRSWLLLAGVVLLWSLAGVIAPGATGAEPSGYWLPACPFRAALGYPCPFCGITTGCAYIARGRWSEAWNSSILSLGLMIGSVLLGIYVVVFRCVAGRRIEIEPASLLRRIFWTGALLLVSISWLINLLKHTRVG